MKKLALTISTIAIAGVSYAALANAGPFDSIRKTVSDVKKTTDDAARTVKTTKDIANDVQSIAGTANTGGSSASSSGGRRAGPPSSNLTSMTQCSNVQISNAMIARLGEYTFRQGMKTEKRTGLINRENVSMTNNCFAPSMASGDTLYFEVDAKQYAAMSSGNNMELQCIESSSGKDSIMSPSLNNIGGNELLLHCGNSEGLSQCATGTNAQRTSEWKKNLQSRNKAMVSFLLPSYHMAKGTDQYCQYYHKPSGKSLVAFQWKLNKTS